MTLKFCYDYIPCTVQIFDKKLKVQNVFCGTRNNIKTAFIACTLNCMICISIPTARLYNNTEATFDPFQLSIMQSYGFDLLLTESLCQVIKLALCNI